MNNKKLTILIFIPYYLPGYKSGGPVRTIANMVDHLGDVFNFLIVTRDRDSQDSVSYKNIKINQWNRVGKSYVYYLSPDKLKFSTITRIIKNTKYDVLYLNSYFSLIFAVLPIMVNKLILRDKKQIVLAPRGEFSRGALNIRGFKKKLFITACSIIGLHKSVTFQASSDFEENDIMNNISNRHYLKIKIAPNLPQKLDYTETGFPEIKKKSNPCRLVFLSRISPKKNLEYALLILSNVTVAVEFSIYGPIGNRAYWHKCQKIINNLHDNIKVQYMGDIKHELVRETLESYDLFFFPTAGENFGHVILESFSAGTPVLISDTTPWRNLQSLGVGWDISLSKRKDFIDIIEKISAYSENDYSQLRKNAVNFADKIINDPKSIEANQKLFISTYNMSE